MPPRIGGIAAKPFYKATGEASLAAVHLRQAAALERKKKASHIAKPFS
jgi:hypothetical protein